MKEKRRMRGGINWKGSERNEEMKDSKWKKKKKRRRKMVEDGIQ